MGKIQTIITWAAGLILFPPVAFFLAYGAIAFWRTLIFDLIFGKG